MTDYKTLYRLDSTPIGRGGFAEVFSATSRADNSKVALKRSLIGPGRIERMRREIDVLQNCDHANIMPILEADSEHRWYAMPRALGDLMSLPPTDDSGLIAVVEDVAAALQYAHSRKLLHRDITPKNVMLLDADGTTRWVVGDWGTVRRPLGQTTSPLTRTGVALGTDGFAAPELSDDAHAAGPAADVYGLGRIVAWAAAKAWPKPNLPLLPDGVWRTFVQKTTHLDRSLRATSIDELLSLLEQVRSMVETAAMPPSPSEEATALAERIGRGDRQAFLSLLDLADRNAEDHELYFDHVDRLTPLVPEFLRTRRDTLTRVAEALGSHLARSDWGRRSYGDTSGPLGFLFALASTAADLKLDSIAHDAARSLFEGEARWQRFSQRRTTRSWLVRLRGSTADAVARALLSVPSAARWYLEDNWTPDRAVPALEQALRRSSVPETNEDKEAPEPLGEAVERPLDVIERDIGIISSDRDGVEAAPTTLRFRGRLLGSDRHVDQHRIRVRELFDRPGGRYGVYVTEDFHGGHLEATGVGIQELGLTEEDLLGRFPALAAKSGIKRILDMT